MTAEPLTLVAGRDTPLFVLDRRGRFRLAADAHQWIIQELVSGRYRSRKFLTDKKGLYRAMDTLGCHPTKAARAEIDGWPDYFKVWLYRVISRGGTTPIEGGRAREEARLGVDLPANSNAPEREAA